MPQYLVFILYGKRESREDVRANVGTYFTFRLSTTRKTFSPGFTI